MSRFVLAIAFALAGPDQWEIHVPLGKLKTERMVPVDGSIWGLVRPLAFFRSLNPLPAKGAPGSFTYQRSTGSSTS